MKPITIDGTCYPSIYVAARTYGISPQTLRKKIAKGTLKLNDKVTKKGKNYFYLGEEYTSLKKLRDHLRISMESIHESLSTGKSLTEIRNRKKDTKIKRITINGIRYKSQNEAAKALNISESTVSKWARRGLTTFPTPNKDHSKEWQDIYDAKHNILLFGKTYKIHKYKTNLPFCEIINTILELDWGKFMHEDDAKKIIPKEQWRNFNEAHRACKNITKHPIFVNIYNRYYTENYKPAIEYDPFADGLTTISARIRYRWTEIGLAYKQTLKNHNKNTSVFSPQSTEKFKFVFARLIHTRFADELKPYEIIKNFTTNRTAHFYPIDIIDGCIDYLIANFDPIIQQYARPLVVYDSNHPEYLAKAEGLSYGKIFDK